MMPPRLERDTPRLIERGAAALAEAGQVVAGRWPWVAGLRHAEAIATTGIESGPELLRLYRKLLDRYLTGCGVP
jgi:hypothetical protein